MDIRSIIIGTRNYNFHTHTQYCDGRASMAEMAEAALRAGITHLGFSPHAPISVDSPCNMDRDAVEEYLHECSRLRGLYEGKMAVYAGMEIDFLDEACSPSAEYFQSLPLDFRIGSVHFVPTRDGRFIDCDGRPERFAIRLQEDFGGDLEYVVSTYFSQVIKMIRLGGFDIIGHIDKIARNAEAVAPGIEQSAGFRELLMSALSEAAASGLLMEINTKELDSGNRIFPAEQWLDEVRRLRISVLVNSDAHYPDRIQAGREEAFQILAKHDLIPNHNLQII